MHKLSLDNMIKVGTIEAPEGNSFKGFKGYTLHTCWALQFS